MTPGDKLLLFTQNELRRCKSQSQGMAQKKYCKKIHPKVNSGHFWKVWEMTLLSWP